MAEEWREFSAPNYEVSSMGRVRRSKPGRRTFAGRVLSPIRQKCGYLSVRPVIGGKNVHYYVHDVVSEAFIGPKPDGSTVNHKNGNKHDNRVENLEYVSHAGNMAHAATMGLMPSGESHHNAKLSDNDVRELRAMALTKCGLRAICDRFSISPARASTIINMKGRVL